jgi:uncharacterized membrane protein YfcA
MDAGSTAGTGSFDRHPGLPTLTGPSCIVNQTLTSDGGGPVGARYGHPAYHLTARGLTVFRRHKDTDRGRAAAAGLQTCWGQGRELRLWPLRHPRRMTRPSNSSGPLAFGLGGVIGAAAGLVGVGGGEFRIPALLHVLRLPVKTAAGANMVIGLFVVILAVARRWPQQSWGADSMTLGGVMAAASLVGAAVGVRRSTKVSSPLLEKVILVYLTAVGCWMIFEGLTQADHSLLNPTGLARWALAAGVGFAIAVVSGALGVAGGEMRIPALLYLFAIPIKEAGTISLLVSVPTVAIGAISYRRLGYVPNSVLRVAVLMGLGSLVGVLVGVALLPLVDAHTLKAVLGAILLIATLCLRLPGFFRARAEHRTER